MRFVWGALWIVAGFGLIKYSFALTNFFGRMDWAEQHIGSGGTYTMYKIVGVAAIIIALLYMFGSIGFLVGPLSPLFGGK